MPIKVWVVTAELDWETSFIIGVYTSAEEAEKAKLPKGFLANIETFILDKTYDLDDSLQRAAE